MRMHKNILGGGHLLGASATALVLLGGLMLFPTGSGAVQAEEAGTQATLKVQPILSVALDAAVQLEVTPTEEGSFSASSAKLEVSTNNETGYSLYLATANGESTLKSLNPATTAEVQAVAGEVMATGFGANTWGYNLGQAATEETIYQAVPTATGEPQVTTTGPTAGDGAVAADVYSLNFGAKVDADLPSGTYGNEVVVSVVTNPEYVPIFDGIRTMQEMTSDICTNAEVNDTARLTDARDGKVYWVAKLADGNCWMTQNLDFDASGVTLSPETSNVEREATASVDASIDYGEYVYSDPTSPMSCSDEAIASLAECVGKGFVDVSDMMAADGLWHGNANNVVSGGVYDAHYLVGNLFDLSDNSNIFDKGWMCPKGWELPSANPNDNSSERTFYGLLIKYGLTEDTISDAYNIALNPLYFVRGGSASTDGRIQGAGMNAAYASSYVQYYGAAYGYKYYGLGIRGTSVLPAGLLQVGGWTSAYTSVRCVAR